MASCTPEEALLAGNLSLLGIERADMGLTAATAPSTSNRTATANINTAAVDLAVVRGAFRRPNARALEVVLHHLYCVLHGRAQARRAFKGCWPIAGDKRVQKEFYAKVQEWLRSLREAGAFGAGGGNGADNNNDPPLSVSAASVSSALRSASGPRVVALLAELSTFALRSEHARLFPEDAAARGAARLTSASAGADALLSAAAARDPYLAAAASGPLLTAARLSVAREAETLLAHARDAEELRRAAERGAAALRDRFYALTAAERRLRAAVAEAGLSLPPGLEAAMRQEEAWAAADEEEDARRRWREQQGGGGRYGGEDEGDDGEQGDGGYDADQMARRRAAVGVPMDLEAVLGLGEEEVAQGRDDNDPLPAATERRATEAWRALEAQLPALSALGPLLSAVLGPEEGGGAAAAAAEHPHAVDGAELRRLAAEAGGGGGGGGGGNSSRSGGGAGAWPPDFAAASAGDDQQAAVDVTAMLESWVEDVEQLGGRVRQLAGALPLAAGGAAGQGPPSSQARRDLHLHLLAAISAHGAGLADLRALQRDVGARLAAASARQPELRRRADEGVAEEEGRWRREAREAADAATAANAVAYSVMLGGGGEAGSGGGGGGGSGDDDGADARAAVAAAPLQLVPPTPVLMRLAREHALEEEEEGRAGGGGVLAAEPIAEEEEEDDDEEQPAADPLPPAEDAQAAPPTAPLPSFPPESAVRPRRLSYAQQQLEQELVVAGGGFATPAAAAVGGAGAGAGTVEAAVAAASATAAGSETQQPPESQLHALRARFARVAEK